MSSTVIIIPSRLSAKRFPNKPLKVIGNKEIIVHVHNLAVKSGVGEVLVVTPDKSISELIDGFKFPPPTIVCMMTHNYSQNFICFISCKH